MTYMHSQPHNAWEAANSCSAGKVSHQYSFRSSSLARITASLSLFCGGLLGGSLILPSQAAWAEPAAHPVLLAQRVVDGLPPPPPLIFGQEALPSGQAQQSTRSSQAAASPQRYVVVVNGDSPLLLSQVQTVASGASVQQVQGKRIIQAGVFADAAQAQQQVATLAAQGIGAQVLSVGGSAASGTPASTQSSSRSTTAQANSNSQAVPPPDLLPVAPVPREVEFGQPPPADSNQSTGAPATPPSSSPDNASGSSPADSSAAGQQSDSSGTKRLYYVVIPGGSRDLSAISNQVIRLGDGMGIAQVVQESTAPRGPHVRVGPFADRNAATRWSRYLHDFGLDARVYYKR